MARRSLWTAISKLETIHSIEMLKKESGNFLAKPEYSWFPQKPFSLKTNIPITMWLRDILIAMAARPIGNKWVNFKSLVHWIEKWVAICRKSRFESNLHRLFPQNHTLRHQFRLRDFILLGFQNKKKSTSLRAHNQIAFWWYWRMVSRLKLMTWIYVWNDRKCNEWCRCRWKKFD